MFRTHLRNLDRAVDQIDHLLRYALNLIAKDKGIFHARLDLKAIEHHSPFDLLDGQHPIAFCLQLLDHRPSHRRIRPLDRHLGTKSRLVNVACRRRSRNTAQIDFLDSKGVSRAEEGPHILHRTDIVQHHHYGHLLHRSKGFNRGTVQLFVGNFSHI